jgi:predicted MFS family arabinose efflux permease
MDVENPAASRFPTINPLAPLLVPAYRNFWIAGLFSNIGTWMHETGSLWLMTEMAPRPEMVSAVRVVMTIPVFCLALPAGVWADRFDRRSWLLSTQLFLLFNALLMAFLSLTGNMNPPLLLLLTAIMGVALILNLPAWQALTPELVPPDLIASAVQAGSVSFNLARSVGPAIAGLIIARFGVGAAFLLNAFSFLGILVALILWRPSAGGIAKRRGSHRFFDELRTGMALVSTSVNIRSALIRVFTFTFAASSLWSLLSLVATQRMGFRERGFGACLAALGVGAVLAATVLPWLRARLTSERIILIAQNCMAGLLIVIGTSASNLTIGGALLVIGACWMFCLTTLNATAQINLPSEFRARGMSAFVMSFALGMCVGSLCWGWLARAVQLDSALVIAGIAMAVSAWLTNGLPLGHLQQQPIKNVSEAIAAEDPEILVAKEP